MAVAEHKPMKFGRMAWRLGVTAAGAAVLLGLGGCADQAARSGGGTTAPELPWWVASPSAPLPLGFPAPGPLGEVVIKEYPAYRAAVTRGDEKSADGTLFFPLFNHIEKHDIAMSSPVALTYGAAGNQTAGEPGRSMAFIYGNPGVGVPGEDGTVAVVSFPAGLFASLGVTGSYTEERYQETLGQLQAWLKLHEAEYRVAGEPRYLAYNSPFVLPFMRYGEVQIPVVRQGAAR